MENTAMVRCPDCGELNAYRVAEEAPEERTVICASCGAATATVGQLHALMAQQALGLGATELRDDHVPVDGELGERPGV